jgi:hypothetical protein
VGQFRPTTSRIIRNQETPIPKADKALAFLEDLPILDIDDETRQLAKTIMADVPLPTNADVDALHIAVAAMSGMDYLLTWN